MMRTFKREEGYREEDLLQYGIDHISAAKILYETHPKLYDSAAYLVHIGIELILKAIKLFHTDSFESTHSLIKLYEYLKNNHGFSLESKNENYLKELDKWEAVCYPCYGNKIVEVGSDDWENVESLFDVLYYQMPEKLQLKVQELNQI